MQLHSAAKHEELPQISSTEMQDFEASNRVPNSQAGDCDLRHRVLVLLSNTEFGGIAVQAREQVVYLTNRSIVNHLCLLNNNELQKDRISWYTERLRIDSLPERVEQSNGLRRIGMYYQHFKSKPETIFHFHCFSQEFMNWHAMLAARLSGKKVVATLHHTVGWTRKPSDPTFILQRFAWHLAHQLIVTTQAGKNLIEQRVPKNKTEVIPCMIPALTQRHTRKETRRSLGLSDNDFVVAVVARLVASKGILDLVAAVSLLLPDHPQLKLIVVGEGPCRPDIEKYVGDSSKIHLLGHVPNIDNVLPVADLFVLPSYEEGFGMVYAEAARHGIPSIASDLPQTREVVIDGETGWLVSRGSVEHLGALIHQAYANRDECARRGRNAKEYCKRFEPENVMENQIKLYESL